MKNSYLGYGNTYTFKRPKNANYMKIINFMKDHRNESFSRADLIVKSNYLSGWRRDAYLAGRTYAIAGWNCYVFAALNYYDILNYDVHTKKWSIGSNFDSWYNEHFK